MFNFVDFSYVGYSIQLGKPGKRKGMTCYKGQVLDSNNSLSVELSRACQNALGIHGNIKYILYNINCKTFGDDQIEHYLYC